MKKTLSLMLTIVLLLSFSSSLTLANTVEKENYIIGFNHQMDEQLIQKYHGEVYNRLPMINAIAAKLPKDIIPILLQEENINYIEKDAVVSVDNQYMDPGLQNLNVYTSQPSEFSGKGIKVAVLDTGIDTSNPDLIVHGGVSFIDGVTSYNDDNGHGTHVAGIIAAQDNTVGIVGVAPNVELYSVKVMESTGDGPMSSLVKGVQWAVNQGMDIINLSLGSPQASFALETALDYAYHNGVMVVAATGNYEDTTAEKVVQYPAKYPTVIGVSAIDKNKQHPDFSAQGPEVELVAPGVDIVSTYLNGELASGTGTSDAAPFVTGILALYKQAYPDKTSDEIREILQTTAIDLGEPGRDNIFGFGLVQAPPAGDIVAPSVPKLKDVQVKKLSDNQWNVQLGWLLATDNFGVSGYNIYRDGVKINTVKNTSTFIETIGQGEYNYQISAVDTAGNESDLSAAVHTYVPMIFQDVKLTEWYAQSIYKMYQQKLTMGYPGGYYKPNQNISRAEAMVMIGRALKLPSENRDTVFSDVLMEDTYSGFIQSAVDQRIVSGYPDGTFRPNNNITRGEVVAILDQSYEISGTDAKSFSDVKQSQYYYNAIMHLAAASIANGYPDGTFRPDQPVTRAEFAVFLIKTMEANITPIQ